MTDAVGSSPQSPGRDPGLQGERTSLAWTRTALALAVNALLALRSGWESGQLPLTVVGVVLMLAAGAAVAYGSYRGRALAGHTAHTPQAAPSAAIAITTAATFVAAGAGIASVLIQR